MRVLTQSISLRTQLLALAGSSVGMTSVTAWISPSSSVRLLTALAVGSSLGLLLLVLVVNRVVRSLRVLRRGMEAIMAGDLTADLARPMPNRDLTDLQSAFQRMVAQLRQAKSRQEESEHAAAARSRTMDRLLEFSQTIQGAGKGEQIFPTMCHFLESEIGLSGVAVLAHETDPPTTQVKATCPPDFLGAPVSEFDTALCPCLRQSQPRLFRAGAVPVRCTIDQYLKLPADHEAYCIPFNVGRKSQVVVHMLLPHGESWTEQRRQLAQTYASAAQSSLTSLHLLSEAEQQSMTDALTGLYNRRSLDQLLSREVALAERHQRPLSIVMIDMDHFKQVNDAHGHAAGDHLLKTFADCVRMTLRKTDLAFRYGGDEFAVALPQTTVHQAEQVVQKLRQAFASVDFTSAIAHLDQQPTLSIGVAERCAAHNLLTLPALLAAADQALYEAKSGTRNCIRLYTPPQAA